MKKQISKMLEYWQLLLVLCLVFSGCGGDGGGTPQVPQEGTFIDSTVEGLEYKSGVCVGVTDSKGSFTYTEGETVTFFIGNVMLGKATAKPLMTPLDLVEEAVDENHQAVVNIARFLQSLDVDGDIDDVINISGEVRAALKSAQYINFNQATEDFTNDPNVEALFEKLNASKVFANGKRALCEAAKATEHFRVTLNTNPTITVKSPNGKEFVSVVSSFEITWEASSNVENVTIFFSQDGGETWNATPIVAYTTNDGSFTWDSVPMAINNTLNRIRIIDANNASVYDDSNSNFTILLPMDELTEVILSSEGIDRDGDHLPDDLEEALGTDPDHPDSDRDGIGDYAEIISNQSFGNYDFIPDLDQDGIIAALDADDDGDGIHDGEGIDTDGDGIANYLEINGYTYNWYTDSYALWDGVSFDVPYFKTDPRQISTDQDPYSDAMESSGRLLDVLIETPGDLPMVPAYPDIVVHLEGYDITLNSDISYTHGKSLGKEANWSRQASVEHAYQHGISFEVGAEAKVGATEWLTISTKLGYNFTATQTVNSTRTTGGSITSGENWEKAVSSNPATAARVKLKLKVYNYGTAAASNVLPTLTMKIGGMSVLTFKPSEPISILEPGGVYPANESTYWVVDKTDPGSTEGNIFLTLDELRAIETGTPLNIEVTQMDGEVMLLDSEGKWESAGKWAEYMARCDAVCANIKLDIGNGNFIHHLVYADDSMNAPVVNLGDALRWIASYEEREDSGYIKYVDRQGLMQETSLADWNFIFDLNTLLQNKIVQGDGEPEKDINLTDIILSPDSSILARAPREAVGVLSPEIYYAYFDVEKNLVNVRAGDYNGIEKSYFVDKDGKKYEMTELLKGSGVFVFDVSEVGNGDYEPEYLSNGILIEGVLVINKDGQSFQRQLAASFMPTKPDYPVDIVSVSVNELEHTLTATLSYDSNFPPDVIKAYIEGEAVDLTLHPLNWHPDHKDKWIYVYDTLTYTPQDFIGAWVIAKVTRIECDDNFDPNVETDYASDCFATYMISVDDIAENVCRSGGLTLSGYWTHVPFANIGKYNMVDFDIGAATGTCDEPKIESREEEIFWSRFSYPEVYDLALLPDWPKGKLEARYGAFRVENTPYENINSSNIQTLAAIDDGPVFHTWRTPVFGLVEAYPDEVWILRTNGDRYIKVKINYTATTGYPFHATYSCRLSYAIYDFTIIP